MSDKKSDSFELASWWQRRWLLCWDEEWGDCREVYRSALIVISGLTLQRVDLLRQVKHLLGRGRGSL